MATHYLSHHTVNGLKTACGRYFDSASLPRGVVVQTGISGVSCQGCIGSDEFRKAKARVGRALDDPRIPHREHQ